MASKDQRARLGPNVRAHRLQLGLTQLELAEVAEMADATLSRIERGKLTPSVELAERIAQALGTSVDALLSAKKPTRRPKLRPCEARLVALVRNLDDAQVDDLTRSVKTLLAVGGVASTRKSGRQRR